jgi:uncharacterized protein (DUF2267 family)
MTKWFLYVMRDRLEKENSLLKYIGLATHEGVNPEWYYPPRMKSREAYFRKRRALNRASAKSKVTRNH